MRPVTVTVGPLATASANNICTSQTPTGAFTLNGTLVSGGVATLDTPRRILFTAASNESAKTITIVGTDWNYAPQTEVITGPNATTGYTNLDFRTVTSITISAAATGAFTVGTNTIASSMWVRLDSYALGQVAIQCTATGTVNYTVQQTLQDPNNPLVGLAPYQVVWINTSDVAAVGATASIQTNYGYAPLFARVTLNSGTGSISAVFSQLGSSTH